MTDPKYNDLTELEKKAYEAFEQVMISIQDKMDQADQSKRILILGLEDHTEMAAALFHQSIYGSLPETFSNYGVELNYSQGTENFMNNPTPRNFPITSPVDIMLDRHFKNKLDPEYKGVKPALYMTDIDKAFVQTKVKEYMSKGLTGRDLDIAMKDFMMSPEVMEKRNNFSVDKYNSIKTGNIYSEIGALHLTLSDNEKLQQNYNVISVNLCSTCYNYANTIKLNLPAEDYANLNAIYNNPEKVYELSEKFKKIYKDREELRKELKNLNSLVLKSITIDDDTPNVADASELIEIQTKISEIKQNYGIEITESKDDTTKSYSVVYGKSKDYKIEFQLQ